VPARPARDRRGSALLVALDVDGTVLTPDGDIAPSTAAAVAAAESRGVSVVLASSRGPVALERIQAGLGLLDEWFIGYQGAMVARRVGSGLEILAEQPVDPATALEVEDRAEAAGVSIGRYIGARWRVPRVTAAIRREAAETGEEPLVSTPQQRNDDAAPHKLAAMADGPAGAEALRRLAASLPTGVSAVFSHPWFLEITAAGVDKAAGLRSLAAELGVPLESTAAVGDGLNDLGLFAAVGTAVAMGQAQAEVQAAADWITSSNTEDGVARALAHLGLAPGHAERA
jgi:Cof subfamily protein (haloacid dehalogenase superfamily)